MSCHGWHLTATFLFAAFECWLGKTSRVSANSTLELLFNFIRRGI